MFRLANIIKARKNVRMEYQKTKNSDKLFKLAKKGRDFSHSPYSLARVGAAILFKDGSTYHGCNIENASYGGTVCAERVAIWKGISELKTKSHEIVEVVVVTDSEKPWPPCGFCRQVMAEFATSETVIHALNLQKTGFTWAFADLLPESFTPKHLREHKKKNLNKISK